MEAMGGCVITIECSSEPEKKNFKFHRNWENTGTSVKSSCVRFPLEKFEAFGVGFLRPAQEMSL